MEVRVKWQEMKLIWQGLGSVERYKQGSILKVCFDIMCMSVLLACM